jgi:hypothetical protein
MSQVRSNDLNLELGTPKSGKKCVVNVMEGGPLLRQGVNVRVRSPNFRIYPSSSDVVIGSMSLYLDNMRLCTNVLVEHEHPKEPQVGPVVGPRAEGETLNNILAIGMYSRTDVADDEHLVEGVQLRRRNCLDLKAPG